MRYPLCKFAGFCLLTAVLVDCSHSEPVKKPEPKTPPQLAIEQLVLANGMKVLVLEDHSAPVVTVQMWFKVGSRNEHVGVRGLAHLTEHLMFAGSENIAPDGHSKIIDAVGGRDNAFTTEDVTAYFDTVPSDRLSLIMELEAERLARVKLDDTHFYKEREVVKEEIRQKLQNNPFGALQQRFRSIAYKKHPYNWTAGGTLEDLDKTTPQDLRSFYRTYYQPNNAVLVVVGDTTLQEVTQLARQHFAPLKKGPAPPAVTAVEPEQTEMRREELKYPTQLPVIFGGYKIPPIAHPDTPVLKVISRILGDGESSRLHRALVRDKKLAVFAGAWNMAMKDPGLFLIGVGFLPSAPQQVVEQTLLQEVEKLGQNGPTEQELAKAKNQLTSSYVFELTSMESKGFAIGRAEAVEGDYRRFVSKQNMYDAVTAQDVKRVASTYLQKKRLTVAVLTPPSKGDVVKKAQATVVAAAAKDVKEWPTDPRFLNLASAKPDPIVLPPVTQKQLANGLKLLVIERHEQPIVYLDMMLPGGSMLEAPGKSGAADLMTSLLTKGTKTRSAEEIAELVDGMGARLSAYSAGEYFNFYGRFLARDFQVALDLFADATLNSTFPKQELQKEKPRSEGGVRSNRDSPDYLAFQHLFYLVHGYQHPRGRPTSLVTLQSITRDDVVQLYNRGFRPNGAILAVTGDVDPAVVIPQLEKAFAAWPRAEEEISFPEPPARFKGQKRLIVDKPDLTQSTVAVAHLGIGKAHPEHIPLVLGNWVLGGGGTNSRLMQNLRKKGGKTYNAGSQLVAGRTAGPFVAYTFTRNQETRTTLVLLLDELKKAQRTGITQEELNAAKNKIAGSYMLTLQPPSGVADQLILAEFYGQGIDWVRNYRKNFTQPSLDQVNQALNKNLDPDNLAVVVVGKAADIREQLSEFGTFEEVNYLAPVPAEERK